MTVKHFLNRVLLKIKQGNNKDV